MAERLARVPLWIVAGMCALVVLATTNLTVFGVGSSALTYDSVALPRLVVAAVSTVLAWTVWLFSSRSEEFKVRGDVVWALLAGLGVWAVLSTAFSPHRALAILGQSERLEGVVTILLYALVYGIALQVVRNIRDARLVVQALGFASVVVATYGLIQFAGYDPTVFAFENKGFELRRAFGSFGNPNFLAGLLVLALPLVMSLAFGAKRRGAQVAWGAGSVVVAASLVATFTRGAWLAVLVEAVVAGVVWWRGGRENRRTLSWVVLATAVVAGGMVLVSLSLPGELNVAHRISELATLGGSAEERLLSAQIAVAAGSQRPVLGYGPGTFLPVLRLHRSDTYASDFGAQSTINNAHSWPMNYMATLGVPGALLLVSAIAAGLWRSRRLLRIGSRSGVSRGDCTAAIWIGCLGFSVHMLFSVAVLGSTIPFWVLLAVLGAPFASEYRLPLPVRTVARAAACVSMALALWISASLVMADATYLSSRDAFTRGDYEQALALAREARSLNPTSVKYARGAAESAQIEMDAAVAAGAPQAEVRSAYEKARTEFDWVLRQSPNDYPALAWFAALQAEAGIYLGDVKLQTAAVATARRAAELDRQHVKVAPLAEGDLSREAIVSAATVPRLP